MNPSSRRAHEPQTESSRSATWATAIWTAAMMLLVSLVAFVFVPNQLIAYLSLHLIPRARDLLVGLWWIVAFIGCCWLFVRLQRGRVR